MSAAHAMLPCGPRPHDYPTCCARALRQRLGAAFKALAHGHMPASCARLPSCVADQFCIVHALWAGHAQSAHVCKATVNPA
eukprot:354346-Chlamydomonas_euryale.AAC.16